MCCATAVVAVFMYFIGFVVVICVISEAAGKTVERQKGKAVVGEKGTDKDRWEDNVYHASAMHRFDWLECNLFSDSSKMER